MSKQKLISILLFGLTAFSNVHALTFKLSDDDVVGAPLLLETKYEDTFVELGKTYGLGFRELVQANPGVLPWVPGEGTEVVLPLSFILPHEDREAIVLNLAEFRIYHFIPEKKTVRSYAVGIGREGWQTPTIEAKVTGTIANPAWKPPESIRKEHAEMGDILPTIVPPGPDNPLGKYAISLSVPHYLFHGTNKKLGIGMRVSHGCVRLYDGDIEELATSARRGTPVRIINEPIKAGWLGDRLFLEVHPSLEETDDESVNVNRIIGEAMIKKPEVIINIDWKKVDSLMKAQNGMPEDITLGSPQTVSRKKKTAYSGGLLSSNADLFTAH